MWEPAVLQALKDCEVPADLVDIDCDEYPCLAVLRVQGTDGRADWHRAEKAERALAGCPALRAAMGWSPAAEGGGDREATIGIYAPFTTSCEDGSLGLLMYATAPGSPATRAVEAAHASEFFGEGALALDASWMPRLARAQENWICD